MLSLATYAADPAAVLQSWLDSPATGGLLSCSEVYRAIVKSRYRTLDHLRQIPADKILTRHEPDVALKVLLDHCGRNAERWEALAAAMTFDYDEEEITFGQLLDSLDPTPAPAQTSSRGVPHGGRAGAGSVRRRGGRAATATEAAAPGRGRAVRWRAAGSVDGGRAGPPVQCGPPGRGRRVRPVCGRSGRG
ncbi:hypothetical protein [Streptomyces youssoufiensis]